MLIDTESWLRQKLDALVAATPSYRRVSGKIAIVSLGSNGVREDDGDNGEQKPVQVSLPTLRKRRYTPRIGSRYYSR